MQIIAALNGRWIKATTSYPAVVLIQYLHNNLSIEKCALPSWASARGLPT